MNTLLMRISLVVQLLSLPLLTPQVVGEETMNSLRERMRKLIAGPGKPVLWAMVAGLIVGIGALFNSVTSLTFAIPYWVYSALFFLMYLATKRPRGFFLLGGFMFVTAVLLQFWATFYPAQ